MNKTQLARQVVMTLVCGTVLTLGSVGYAAQVTYPETGAGNVATGTNTTAVGTNNKASGNNSTAVGADNLTNMIYDASTGTYVDERGDQATAVGYSNTALDRSTAVGNGNTASGTNSFAGGYGNIASGSASTAVGYGNTASEFVSAAVGCSNIVSGAYSIGAGCWNTASGDNAIAVGSDNNASGGRSIAIGWANSASEEFSTAIGSYNIVSKITSTAIGAYNTVSGEYSSVIGMFNEVSADSSNAIGRQNTVSGEFSTAIGFRNTVSGGGSNAIGYMANAGNASNAMGYNSSATGNASNAIGYNSSAAGADSIAMGTDSNASATNSVAIGKGATASNANSVALGSGAETAVAHKGDTAQKVTLAGTEYNYAGLASDTKGTVSVGTKDHERQIQNVAAGDITATSTDAVNGSQLYATNQAVNANKNSITNITNTIGNLTDYAVNDGSTYSADGDGTVTITQNDQNGHSIDTKTYTITDVASKTQQDINTTNIETNTKNIATNTSNIETINNTIGTTNNGTYVSSSNTIGGNINALDDAITDMDNHMNGIDRQVNKLDNRVDRVGAGAAALAALHPLDFDPDAKWDFAAGYGNYRDANAVAVGAFYRPNEDTMFSVGGSFGGGENMVNAGITLKLGGGSHVSTSKVAMAKEIKDLRNEVETLKSAILDQSVGKKLDTSKLQLFPDVPENHWAYQDVAVLAGNGILNGYPDGNFGGDRSMTRYEFASMLYRAMLNGAKLSDKMLKEFAPELERFTVDTVHQDKNGTPTVERVRVVKNS